MKIMANILWILIIMSMGLGCVGEEHTGVSALEFRLEAVDGTGREKSVFEAGERIGITVKLINHSREDVNLTTPLGCWIYQFEKFTVLYRCGETESVGKAFTNTIACAMLPLPYTYPARFEGLATVHYWDENPENEPLPVGTAPLSKGRDLLTVFPLRWIRRFLLK